MPLPSAPMNKSQLVDALADRLGDRKTAATAVDALLQIVVDTVRSGDSVSLAGFGVFESRARAARTGRNPRRGRRRGARRRRCPPSARGPASATRSPATAHPRLRHAAARRSRAATNGAGGGARSATAVNGSADLEAPATATVLADAPASTGPRATKAGGEGHEATPKKARRARSSAEMPTTGSQSRHHRSAPKAATATLIQRARSYQGKSTAATTQPAVPRITLPAPHAPRRTMRAGANSTTCASNRSTRQPADVSAASRSRSRRARACRRWSSPSYSIAIRRCG